MTLTADSPRVVFDHLGRTDLPAHTSVLFDTACVLGGSIAGLLAARVLADHARTVLVIERDGSNTDGNPRAGVPQDRQGHVLLPGGRAQIERWLPGVTREAQDRGGVLVGPEQQAVYLGDRQQMQNRETPFPAGTRPFLESRIRSRVLALPNVFTLSARATASPSATTWCTPCDTWPTATNKRSTSISWWTPWDGPASWRTGSNRPAFSVRSYNDTEPTSITRPRCPNGHRTLVSCHSRAAPVPSLVTGRTGAGRTSNRRQCEAVISLTFACRVSARRAAAYRSAPSA